MSSRPSLSTRRTRASRSARNGSWVRARWGDKCRFHHIEWPKDKTRICMFDDSSNASCRCGDKCKLAHISVGKAACDYLLSLKSPAGSRATSADSRGHKGGGKGKKGDDICRAYKQGKCNFGDKCKYKHADE